MKLEIYSVRDMKTGVFHLPFYASSEVIAKRNLMIMMKDERSQLHHYPEDFELFYLGSWEDGTAKFTVDNVPMMISVDRKKEEKV